LLSATSSAACRCESSVLRRSKLSSDVKTWTIPGSRYKNGRDLVVPLSRWAQKIIASMPVLPGGDFVFSGDGASPLGNFADRKAAFDAACKVHGWVIHDLRRAARTLLSRAGVNADIAERCLGHALTGVRRVYDRQEFQCEKAAAFEALAQMVERIVRPPPDVVVPIAGAKRARRK